MDKMKQHKTCCCNINTATKIISILGMILSLELITIFLTDTFRQRNYENSRIVALTLGLDWQHFHHSANATREADPDGKLISVILIVYSLSYLFINAILMLGVVKGIRLCAVPWLVFESLGCASKVGALIYHSIADNTSLNKIFFTGSLIYILVITWCFLIVVTAQKDWKNHRRELINQEDVENQTCISMRSTGYYEPPYGYNYAII